MLQLKVKRSMITVFVVSWLSLFFYETTRVCTLNPLFRRELPKCKFLFPPAGWIMFYNVGEQEGHCEVYGAKGERYEFIDPHRIFNDRWLGYDNIHRNVLISVLNPAYVESFCRYLKRKFPEYDSFHVFYAITPSNIQYPGRRVLKAAFSC